MVVNNNLISESCIRLLQICIFYDKREWIPETLNFYRTAPYSFCQESSFALLPCGCYGEPLRMPGHWGLQTSGEKTGAMTNGDRFDAHIAPMRWKVSYWILFACWVLGAALDMMHVRGGFLTNYLADLTFPPWYYIVIRGLSSGKDRVPRLLRWFGQSPERTAISIFLVGAATEISQLYWPRGLFKGTYDTWDIVAYALGLAICYSIERDQIRSDNVIRGARQPEELR